MSQALLPHTPKDNAERLAYLELTAEDHRLLTELAAALLPHLDELIHTWHEFLRGHPAIAPLLDRGHGGGHLLAAQRSYFRSLLTGEHNARYFAERARVGKVHHKVGLAPFWYLGAYRKFLDLVRDLLHRRGHETDTMVRWTAALEKVVTLDLAIALDAYQEQEQAALRRTNQELEKQMQQSREATRLKQEFLSRISHELRTPLHGMLGFADLVADGIQGPVTPEQHASLTKVRIHGERVVAMVDQLIEAAKLAAGSPRKPEPFDPAPLLDEAAMCARDAATVKGLKFTSNIDTPVLRVSGDRRGTAVAVRQLLDNAVRFTPAGRIRLEVHRVGKQLHIAVIDSGPGIPPDHTDRIFEPFHQVEGGDDRSVQGIGMGLALARETVERSGGQLTLESSGPEGSTFVINLPLALPAETTGTTQ